MRLSRDPVRLLLVLLQRSTAILFAVIFLMFGLMAPRFLTLTNLVDIVVQSSHVAIIAVGMTFVLLIAGIDLSVGANMYVCAMVLGLFLAKLPLLVSFPLTMLVGLLFGALNAYIVSAVRVAAFIATLASQFVGRGLALYFSGSKMVMFGPAVSHIGRMSLCGIPSSIWALLVVLIAAHVTLSATQFGRQIYAVGADPETASKAGIDVKRIQFAVYCICGLCAGIGGLVSLTQVAAASSVFGDQEEFSAIAAAVLGGVSLFGGRGSVLGTVFGAILIHTVQSGLVMINANPYIYPLVVSIIIFLAVLVDSVRTRIIDRFERRTIRIEPAARGSNIS
jgi:ribose transport system permease protein